MIAAVGALSVAAYGYVFLTGHRAEIDGAALQAMRTAYYRAPTEIRAPHALLNYTVSAQKLDGGSFSVTFEPFSDAFHASPRADWAAAILAKDIGDEPQPANSRPITPFESSPTILGSDLEAFFSGYRTWTAYQTAKHRRAPLASRAVLIQQFIYLGRIEYGISFTDKWYVSGTLGCDDQVMIDPATFAPATTMSSIC